MVCTRLRRYVPTARWQLTGKCTSGIVTVRCLDLFPKPNYAFITDATQDYCVMETFRPQCWKSELVVMTTATYGRRMIGRCIDEAIGFASFGDDPLYVGCFSDVLDIADQRCYGKITCEIRIPDSEMQKTMPCYKGLTMYFEASYSCVAGKYNSKYRFMLI